MFSATGHQSVLCITAIFHKFVREFIRGPGDVGRDVCAIAYNGISGNNWFFCIGCRESLKCQIGTACRTVSASIGRACHIMIRRIGSKICETGTMGQNIVHNIHDSTVLSAHAIPDLRVARFVCFPLDDHLILKPGSNHWPRNCYWGRNIRGSQSFECLVRTIYLVSNRVSETNVIGVGHSAFEIR